MAARRPSSRSKRPRRQRRSLRSLWSAPTKELPTRQITQKCNSSSAQMISSRLIMVRLRREGIAFGAASRGAPTSSNRWSNCISILAVLPRYTQMIRRSNPSHHRRAMKAGAESSRSVSWLATISPFLSNLWISNRARWIRRMASCWEWSSNPSQAITWFYSQYQIRMVQLNRGMRITSWKSRRSRTQMIWVLRLIYSICSRTKWNQGTTRTTTSPKYLAASLPSRTSLMTSCDSAMTSS